MADRKNEPQSASALSVARVAQERAGKLVQDVILRNALILDLQDRVDALEAEVSRLGGRTGDAPS